MRSVLVETVLNTRGLSQKIFWTRVTILAYRGQRIRVFGAVVLAGGVGSPGLLPLSLCLMCFHWSGLVHIFWPLLFLNFISSTTTTTTFPTDFPFFIFVNRSINFYYFKIIYCYFDFFLVTYCINASYRSFLSDNNLSFINLIIKRGSYKKSIVNIFSIYIRNLYLVSTAI